MYELFNDETEYFLPSGRKVAGKSLKDESEYKYLTTGVWCCDIVDGMLKALYSLGDLKEQYGVVEEDQTVALSGINAAKIAQQKNEVKVRSATPAMYTAAAIVAATFTDEQALEVKELYPEFEIGYSYKKDDRFTYNGRLFKVNQDHTSQDQWIPGETGTESLYTNLELNEGGYLVWKQPTGAHDAYNKDDIVEYNGQLYKSLINGNVYSPDAYPAGWEKYTKS